MGSAGEVLHSIFEKQRPTIGCRPSAEDHSIHTRHDVDRYMFPKVVQDNAQPNISYKLLENSRIISQESTLGSQGDPSYRVFSMEELEEAIENLINQHCSVKAPLEKVNLKDREAVAGTWRKTSKVPMAIDSVDVLERIASQLLTTSHEQQFNEEEIQAVPYPNKLFADMKSEPLSNASVPNMDVVINAPVSGGISLMPLLLVK
ncbi:hypothetical protein T459_09184 [Capsicum annuum]|uniref:Uncharacterized protein n=1 Tax=Capsicum annuum TaxID=4072 RepID=A0A2G2ZYM9_CAPAN|nr:hypothetical protein T459_09184 [Capsicum annuum]